MTYLVTHPDGRVESLVSTARSLASYPTVGYIVVRGSFNHSGYVSLRGAARLLALPDYMFPGRTEVTL